MARKTGPHAKSDLAVYLDRRILELRHKKNQSEIATAAGFTNVNMLTIIKQGHSKLAIDRVATLAAALEVDPKFLLRLALAQDGNETMSRVRRITKSYQVHVSFTRLLADVLCQKAPIHFDEFTLTCRGQANDRGWILGPDCSPRFRVAQMTVGGFNVEHLAHRLNGSGA